MDVYDYLIWLHVINSMKNRAKTKEAKEAINLADEISDEILFHQRVKRNGTKMMEPAELNNEMYYHVSCPYCKHIWWSKNPFPKKCKKCGKSIP